MKTKTDKMNHRTTYTLQILMSYTQAHWSKSSGVLKRRNRHSLYVSIQIQNEFFNLISRSYFVFKKTGHSKFFDAIAKVFQREFPPFKTLQFNLLNQCNQLFKISGCFKGHNIEHNERFFYFFLFFLC
ncbi:hypothetical protein MXB_1184, partial [Myxobolus squamalis]